jgi:precorrin-6B methylase 2
MLSIISQTDYDQIWSEQIRKFNHGVHVAEYWDRRSEHFHCSSQNSTYANELMKLMDLKPGYSVLDVGSGCGAVAIPLATKVKQVTALDISAVRLKKLLDKAEAAGVRNITIRNRDWDQIEIGKDIEKHDVVLLSRGIYTRLSETLQKINKAAKSVCYVTWRAERSDEFESEVAFAMDRGQLIYPDYSIIQDMLRQMGILARAEIFETDTIEYFADLENALLSMAHGAELNAQQCDNLLKIARKRLIQVNSHYLCLRRIKWVLISWEKPTSN